jgi:hypothetical protein
MCGIKQYRIPHGIVKKINYRKNIYMDLTCNHLRLFHVDNHSTGTKYVDFVGNKTLMMSPTYLLTFDHFFTLLPTVRVPVPFTLPWHVEHAHKAMRVLIIFILVYYILCFCFDLRPTLRRRPGVCLVQGQRGRHH